MIDDCCTHISYAWLSKHDYYSIALACLRKAAYKFCDSLSSVTLMCDTHDLNGQLSSAM